VLEAWAESREKKPTASSRRRSHRLVVEQRVDVGVKKTGHFLFLAAPAASSLPRPVPRSVATCDLPD
jgi:hypothetical protein